MKSPVFNAAAIGKMNLPNEWSDFIMATKPFGAIDSLVNMIPIVGRVVTNGENGFLVYYFTIKGSLQRPEVKHVQPKLVDKNVSESLNGSLNTL